MKKLLNIIRDTLFSINHPRFYETERGFQGELIAEMRLRLPLLQWEGAIIEQEYQKRLRDHGIKIRPDIIIHVPFDPAIHTSRYEDNFVAIELKLKASEREAFDDFDNLSLMCERLDYPLGIFININSQKTYLESYDGVFKERLYAFAVSLEGHNVIINE